MKGRIEELIRGTPSALTGTNLVREYLQARILAALQEIGAFRIWAFHGGTALRFLYGIGRYSEDLDFSMVTQGQEPGFCKAILSVQADLQREGYQVNLKLDEERVVAGAFVRFPGLLEELGLAPRRSRALSVKVEVDTRPPDGATLETTVVRRHILLHLHHHDRATLLAGKLHAILSRAWTKGRDLYDLVWYLSDPDWPEPNLAYLNAALAQTGWKAPPLAAESWRLIVLERLANIDWENSRVDVSPFVERMGELDLIRFEVMERLLARSREPS
ncbi:MAG: nucleotidyl transferase AbiEii/AbiGii toxin family protein [Bradymonadales bacterium]|nr:nucleotidyl transferase AbiEii/AbiGii toxin family protein [Bradymonadales bacterium]